MNERTKELIEAAAQLLASIPKAVLVTERHGRYTIDAAPVDLGAIMGRQRKHAAAIEFLAQQIEPAAVIHVASREATAARADTDLGIRSDWSAAEETALKAKIEYLLRFIHPSASVEVRPAVRESVFVIPASYVLPDVVGALHVIFRAWGRRHGRYVTVKSTANESATA